MRIQLPKKVKYIIQKLEENGYEAYAVGGCVRDTLLGREPGDWDITTSASPEEVKGLFRRTVDTGIVHGTVTILLEKDGFEVTTYRIDGDYEDSRHPSSVTFTKSLSEDLKRRDFTINAMAYNERDGLVDLFGGEEDLSSGCIRCVGNAMARFKEDALRMLRAIRFSAQLGFAVEKETETAIRTLAGTLQKVSRERVQMELTKLLMSAHPEQIQMLFETGISVSALPTLTEYGMKAEKERSRMIRMLLSLPEDVILRWAALLHVKAKEDGGYEVLRELRMDTHTIQFVSRIVKSILTPVPNEKPALRRYIYEVGEDIFPLLLKARRAYLNAANSPEMNEILIAEKSYQEIRADGDCLSLKQLAIGGKDLIAAGIKPGKEMGEILNSLLDFVFEYPDKNKKEVLFQVFDQEGYKRM